MNKQINRQLEMCHMTLERALQGVSHMKQISNLSQPSKHQSNDQAVDLFFESLTQSQGKITVVKDQLNVVQADFKKLVSNHDKTN